jgi:hypothetical protein
MKQDTLLQHKEVIITYEKNIGIAHDYWKLLEPFWHLQKPIILLKTWYVHNIFKKKIFEREMTLKSI